jgi:hypothetical protein
MAAEAAPIPDPHTVWVQSTMTEAKIHALVDRRLLWPKAEVEWKAAVGGEFPTEDVKEQVIFASYFERGFNLPVGDFFRGLLYLAGAGTPCPQLHHCSLDVHSFL